MPARRRRRPGWVRPPYLHVLDRDGFSAHVIPGVPVFPGAVAMAAVRNLREQPDPGRKLRPFVVHHADPDTGAWAGWGLTGKPSYANDSPRPAAVGINQVMGCGATSHLWGSRLAYVPPNDVNGTVWAAPLALLLACATQPGWNDGAPWAEAIHAEHVAAGWYWPKPVATEAEAAAWPTPFTRTLRLEKP